MGKEWLLLVSLLAITRQGLATSRSMLATFSRIEEAQQMPMMSNQTVRNLPNPKPIKCPAEPFLFANITYACAFGPFNSFGEACTDCSNPHISQACGMKTSCKAVIKFGTHYALVYGDGIHSHPGHRITVTEVAPVRSHTVVYFPGIGTIAAAYYIARRYRAKKQALAAQSALQGAQMTAVPVATDSRALTESPVGQAPAGSQLSDQQQPLLQGKTP